MDALLHLIEMAPGSGMTGQDGQQESLRGERLDGGVGRHGLPRAELPNIKRQEGDWVGIGAKVYKPKYFSLFANLNVSDCNDKKY